MDKKRFTESLLLHGTDLHAWPEEIMRAGLEALEKSPDFKMLLKEHEQFERFLHTRKYEKPDDDLTERIISDALPEKQKTFPFISVASAFIYELRFPKPALTAVSALMLLALILGFIVGFLNPVWSGSTAYDETSFQAFLYYEEDIL